MKFEFNVRALKAAALAVAKDETRYYLNGVALEFCGEHAVFVATDGHRLAAFKVPGPNPETPPPVSAIIIPADVIDRLKVPAKAGDAPLAELEPAAGGEWIIRFDGTATLFRPIDGTFPNWRRVLPADNPESNAPGHFNTAYLESFSEMRRVALNLKKSGTAAHAQVIHNGPENPAFVWLMDETPELHGFGVIMPMRGREAEFIRPAWVPFAPVEPAAATVEPVAQAA